MEIKPKSGGQVRYIIKHWERALLLYNHKKGNKISCTTVQHLVKDDVSKRDVQKAMRD